MTKRKKITRAERQSVYDKYGGRCAYCGGGHLKERKKNKQLGKSAIPISTRLGSIAEILNDIGKSSFPPNLLSTSFTVKPNSLLSSTSVFMAIGS